MTSMDYALGLCPIPAATAALQAVGLVLSEVIAAQSPAPGTQVQPGTTVQVS